jgi:hypothetical protein
MPSPFPGMDPYLEFASGWPNVHYSIITGLRDALQAQLRPRYWVSIEERVYIADAELAIGRPDAVVVDRGMGHRPAEAGIAVLSLGIEVYVPAAEAVHEPYLEVRRPGPSKEVVTVIEVLSPANKRGGSGRDQYLEKRGRVHGSAANLVEIDLLREGRRMPSLGPGTVRDYGVLVCRAATRPRARLHPFSVREPIPTFAVPLASADPDAPLDLSRVLSEIYDRGGFDLVLDYAQPPEPPLAEEDAAWADALLREKGLR